MIVSVGSQSFLKNKRKTRNKTLESYSPSLAVYILLRESGVVFLPFTKITSSKPKVVILPSPTHLFITRNSGEGVLNKVGLRLQIPVYLVHSHGSQNDLPWPCTTGPWGELILPGN